MKYVSMTVSTELVVVTGSNVHLDGGISMLKRIELVFLEYNPQVSPSYSLKATSFRNSRRGICCSLKALSHLETLFLRGYIEEKDWWDWQKLIPQVGQYDTVPRRP